MNVKRPNLRLRGSVDLPLVIRDQAAYSPSDPVRVDAVKIVFMLAGQASVSSRACEAVLQRGTVLIVSAGVECQWFPLGFARTVTFYVHPEYLADQVRWLPAVHPLVHHLHRALRGDVDLHTLQLDSSIVCQLTPVLVRLAQLTVDTHPDFAALSLAAEVFDAVGRLSGVSTGRADTVMAMPRHEVATAITLLYSDLRRPWRIDVLSSEIAVSPSQLARLFRAQLGISPAAFLRQIRAERMAELLATTNFTVGEAAAAVGWNDAAFASRLFKQRYGVPPSTYARSYRAATSTKL